MRLVAYIHSAVRFLGLATALLSLGSPYEAAKALYLLLDDSSPKNQLLPTVQELKDLFVVLEYKISASDFVNSLQGWDIILKSSEVGLQDLFIDLDHIQGEGRLISSPEGPSHHLPDISSSPPGEVPCGARSTELSGLGISIAPIPQVRQTSVQGFFIRSCCPPEESIMKLLQALAELGRVGEASSAIIQVPPELAAWCIAFVKWCLGTPPSIRQLKKDGTYKQAALLEQPCSNVFLDIAEPGSKDFYVRNFRKMSRIEDLLWESHFEVSGGRPWAGLLPPKMYFQGRIRDLQSRHNLLHVINTLLVLAQEVPKVAEQFPRPDDIVDLVAMLFDIDNVTTHLKKVDTSEILEFWSGKEPQTIISQLFVEVLILSMVENIRHKNYDDIFVATQENRPSLTRHPFITPLGRWLRQDSGFESLQLPLLRASEICHDVLALLGVDQTGVDGSNPLISSHRGQVAYPSFLETLKLNPRCPLSYRVHQGRLQYEGLYYAYATGDNGTHLAGLLKETPGKSITSSSPLPFQPIPQKAPSGIAENHQWLCSKQDNYLAIYFKPYLHGDYTLDPRHFITACETTTILQECQRDCHTLAAPDEEIRYCADIASVFSCKSIRLLRVLSCQSPIDTLFIQVAWANIWADEERINDMEGERVVLVAKGESCLSCACRAALEILKEKFSGHDLEQARAVIIA